MRQRVLLNPREQRWNRHVRLNGGRIEGITVNAKLYWLAARRCVCGIPDNDSGSRIPEEVLGPDELQRVWQEYLDSSD